ncbi:hypothetical protein BD779DRAFT_1678010 [Infundibulicybe gibba]|nr:hypothetical protein BD779DRAFT_1678010 [Infundibulicybe gibba]
MSDLNGLFLITPHPPGVVETQITRNGLEKPLTLDPPGVADRQEWFVKGVEGKYTFTRLGSDEGFSWVGDIPEPHSAVLFGRPRHFTLTEIEGGPNPIYQIQPDITIFGADYYVGHDGGRVQFVSFPVIAKPPPHEIPAWKFRPIN